MPDIEQALSAMQNLADIEIFAKIIANMVSNEIGKYLGSVYLKIFGGIVSAMASAIVYMYLTQKAERKSADEAAKEASKNLLQVLKESTKLMETVKNGLETSASSERKTRKALEKMVVMVRGCSTRDNHLDNNPLDAIMNQNEEEGEDENGSE